MMHKRHFFYAILLCFIFIFLNGCSSLSRRDGAPPYSVDETKIPDAVPKNEAPSKYGNLSTYRVFGRRYYTLKSSKHYEEQGTASWYGTKFHQVRTSSGERYDMLAMTAAHKTLPLPTYVQVTNLANGKKVIVKVNDRGPFEGNRLIDLSYVAAKKLGMLGHGTAHVDVKAIDPDDYHPHVMADNQPRFVQNKHSTPVARQTSGAFLQVGAFHKRIYADRLKNRLSRIISSPIHLNHTNGLYHVVIGPIHNTKTKAEISEKLKSIGLSGTYTKSHSHAEA